MKQLLAFTLIFTSCSLYAQEQDLESLMTKQFLTCQDIAYNCMSLIPKFHRRGKDDSVRLVLSYWRNACGANVDNIRMEVLLDLDQNVFSGLYYKDELLEALYGYKLDITDGFSAWPTPG
jgi:hypothetical protein